MVMLTWLGDALRGAGLEVIEEQGWRTRGHGQMSGTNFGISGVLCHHTAGGGSNDYKVVRDGRPGLGGPLAHMTLERSGAFRLIAAGQCWHAGNGTHPAIGTNNGNARLVGIEGVSRGVGNDWTPAQRSAYPRGVAAILRHAGLGSDRAILHREWARPAGRKSDPQGFDGPALRGDIARLLATSPTPTPGTPPRPEGLPKMIDREIPAGPTRTGRIICPVGTASKIVGEAYVSASFDGGARVQLWFQKAAPGNDGPAPGAGKPIDWTLRNSDRAWAPVPSGTEFIQYTVSGIEGPGAISVELIAK